MSFDYDLFIIGAGSGGLAAAKRAASYGVCVGITEESAVGGACVNFGCIPEKLISYAASFSSLFPIATSYGWSECNSRFDWSKFITAKDEKLKQLHQLHTEHLKDSGVDFLWGHATFLDAHTLDVDGRKITTDKILLAVGAKFLKPDIPGMDYAITAKELFSLKKPPQHIAIIGGNDIAIKTAGSLKNLGIQVSIITEDEKILINFDAELSLGVQKRMIENGIEIFNNTQVTVIENKIDNLNLILKNENNRCLTVDTVLYLKYTTPNLSHLCLNKAGVETTEDGAILVNEYSKTTQSNIFAIGDCTNRMKLTPVAIAEANAFVDTEFGASPHVLNYELIPIAVSAIPEAATVGMTEAQAREKFGESVQCYRQEFNPLFYALTHQSEKTLIKVVVEGESERVLGVHMVGEFASEIIQNIALALTLGATKRDLDRNIGIHPTISEEIFTL
jgi:glutathione reductase (NADPH)